MNRVPLSPRDLAHALIGLRRMQGEDDWRRMPQIAEEDLEPMDDEELDALCHRLNTAGDESPFEKSEERMAVEAAIGDLEAKYRSAQLPMPRLREELAKLVGREVERDEMELYEFEITGSGSVNLGVERRSVLSNALRCAAGIYRAIAREMDEEPGQERIARQFRRQVRDAELLARYVDAADSGRLAGEDAKDLGMYEEPT